MKSQTKAFQFGTGQTEGFAKSALGSQLHEYAESVTGYSVGFVQSKSQEDTGGCAQTVHHHRSKHSC